MFFMSVGKCFQCGTQHYVPTDMKNVYNCFHCGMTTELKPENLELMADEKNENVEETTEKKPTRKRKTKDEIRQEFKDELYPEIEKEVIEKISLDKSDPDSIVSKLSAIQTRLNAPKGQRNTFGKYNYRSCEDILEALKPHLKEQDCACIVTDEMVCVGERYYIKATAILMSDSESVTVHAYAREDNQKKGMDSAQLTGATSSYARKYALNGMFAIDDNKDPDTDQYSEQTKEAPKTTAKPRPPQQPAKPQNTKPETDEQKTARLDAELKACTDRNSIMAIYKRDKDFITKTKSLMTTLKEMGVKYPASE
jgi:transcription elongation factor Elf1